MWLSCIQYWNDGRTNNCKSGFLLLFLLHISYIVVKIDQLYCTSFIDFSIVSINVYPTHWHECNDSFFFFKWPSFCRQYIHYLADCECLCWFFFLFRFSVFMQTNRFFFQLKQSTKQWDNTQSRELRFFNWNMPSFWQFVLICSVIFDSIEC